MGGGGLVFGVGFGDKWQPAVVGNGRLVRLVVGKSLDYRGGGGEKGVYG
jgi:hypothetical protein